MIKITAAARDKLTHYGAGDGSFVRVLVKSGGCAGMTYDAEIDTTLQPGEKIVFKMEDITIVSNDESLPFLEGLRIDYSNDLISAGFRFNNDTNESSCGCGASFTLAGFPELNKGELSCGT